MTEYECVGGPMDGERLTMTDGDAAEHLIEMNGWAYMVDGDHLVWQRLA